MLCQRSCQRCRLSKQKCDRVAAGCTRCEQSGQQCVYTAPEKPLRIRNQTHQAEQHAVRAWRARAKCHLTGMSTVEPPLATDVETLARQRFLYDFSESNDSLKALSIDQFGFSTINLTKDEHREIEGVEAAFVATSLANFYVRHCDSRAQSLTAPALGKALSSLALSLRAPKPEITHRTVLMAILLGLHQNIRPENFLIGSWVQHFRGSVYLLDAAAKHGMPEAVYANLERLIAKQALCVSLRMELPFPLPTSMRESLASRQDLRSRALSLGACVADFCGHARKLRFDSEGIEQIKPSKQWESLDAKFDLLEADLKVGLPYSTASVGDYVYPQWYQHIAAKPGGPLTVHIYESENAVAIWNAERMARLKLWSVALSCGLFHSTAPSTKLDNEYNGCFARETLVTYMLRLVEDLCASVFYCLSHNHHTSRSISSFQDVAGAKAYALISPLAIAADCLQELLVSDTTAETFEWVTHVLKAMRDRLGISEAWCWSNSDEETTRRAVERALTFENQA